MTTRPKFRIQAVAEKTGVPAATLRAWERRYGLPRPQRTQAAYRMYSENDVRDILKLRSLCDAGLSVSQAAATLLDNSDSSPKPPTGSAPRRTSSNGVYSEAINRFIAATRRMDATEMAAVLAPAALLGSPGDVYTGMIVPTMVTVGDLWQRGELSTGHEHAATELVIGTVRQLLQLAQPRVATRRCLLACFDEELHVLPLYGVAFLLAELGVQSTVLGARTPPAAIAAAVRALDPTLIGLSATVLPSRSRILELAESYASAAGSCPWVVGGAAARAMSPWIERAGGRVASDTPEGVREQLSALIEHKRGRSIRDTH